MEIHLDQRFRRPPRSCSPHENHDKETPVGSCARNLSGDVISRFGSNDLLMISRLRCTTGHVVTPPFNARIKVFILASASISPVLTSWIIAEAAV